MALVARPVPDHPFNGKGDILVIAHRGGKGLWPENTLHAFHKALELGADMIELDLRMSGDGVPVVLHDRSVDRTTDGTGLVQDLTLRELKKLDNGTIRIWATVPIPLVGDAERLFSKGYMPDEWVTEGIRSIKRREEVTA